MVGEVDLRGDVVRAERTEENRDSPSEKWSSLLGQLQTVLTL